jgi:hypothetical protein
MRQADVFTLAEGSVSGRRKQLDLSWVHVTAAPLPCLGTAGGVVSNSEVGMVCCPQGLVTVDPRRTVPDPDGEILGEPE